ncbi:DUF1801 domain-containing protein [Aquisalimonas asiatica]|uniref:YdhG-like domain-containing protein n=1 Tax=Aquisalimonas asiatica TaxID=406100 RepID=A0A1H8VTR8_9GAMM|nr:DUF1801 domain-containing protein [Aquisalimonas asiatica]SEP18745.1 hypothetical protein SAMN04488052_11532 [Aquisalimonas asiatica]
MTTEQVETLLDDVRHLGEAQHAIMLRVRELVLSAGPDVSEEVKYGGVLFSVHSHFCGVFAYAHHVSLEFSEGARLPDPHHVLEGGGKHRRHIKLRGADDISAKRVGEYVRAAYEAARRGQ